MNSSFYLFLFSFFFLSETVLSQYSANYQIEVKGIDNVIEKLAWVGGLNNPQFSEADLNHDDIPDLFIFDRTGNKALTFLNNGTPNTIDYQYAPQYESHFPDMQNWTLLLDYNCDNIADIFTFTNFPATGIRVYKGYYDTENSIRFTLVDSVLEYPFQGFDVNIFVSSVDIPAIVDVNGDGDKDVLTFQQTGGYVMYFENLSQETGQGCDTLAFKKQDECWGDFYESGLKLADDLNQPCPFLNPESQNDEASKDSRHSGSTMLSFDNDGDGDVELITGDVSFTNLVYLTNGGNPSDAHIIEQDTLFPSYDVPTDVYIFAAPFLMDVNNDDLKDLMVSPNWQLGSENYECSWLYKNEGTPITGVFHHQTRTFLVDDMIDAGEGSYPAFFDVDGDGLQDMLIGNYGYFDNSSYTIYISKLGYYRNTGDATHPSFQLMNSDFANISSLSVLAICPTFGDLDGDGDEDMITGRDDGTLLYFKNTALSGSPANFVFMSANYATIDVGNFSAPQLVDVNHDGFIDLLIGERDGNLNYYQNTGTATSPLFTQTNTFFGNVDVRQPGYITGYSVPYLASLEVGSAYTLLVGCERGIVFEYTNIDGNLNGAFTKTDSTFSDISVGSRATVSGADVDDDDKAELLIGNYRGGVTFFDQSAPIGVSPIVADPSVRIFPNPASGIVRIELPEVLKNSTLKCSVVNFLGEKIFTKQLNSPLNHLEMDVSSIPPGVYFFRLSNPNYSFVNKVVISR